jgi:hypothetical protein
MKTVPNDELQTPLALAVAYEVCIGLAPVLVVGLGARLYGFRREWQVLILSYVFIPISLLIFDVLLFRMMVAARTTYIADTVQLPTSYAFDMIRFPFIFGGPLALTALHVRDPHRGG